jgi:hypothetical protein
MNFRALAPRVKTLVTAIVRGVRGTASEVRPLRYGLWSPSRATKLKVRGNRFHIEILRQIIHLKTLFK